MSSPSRSTVAVAAALRPCRLHDPALGRDRPRRHHRDRPPTVVGRHRHRPPGRVSGSRRPGGFPTQPAQMLAHPISRPLTSPSPYRGTGASTASRPELVREMRRRLGCPSWSATPRPRPRSGPAPGPGDPDEVVAAPSAGLFRVEMALIDDEAGRWPSGGRRVRLRSGAVDARPHRELATARPLTSGGHGRGARRRRLDHHRRPGLAGADGDLRLVGRMPRCASGAATTSTRAEVQAAWAPFRGCEAGVVGLPDPFWARSARPWWCWPPARRAGPRMGGPAGLFCRSAGRLQGARPARPGRPIATDGHGQGQQASTGPPGGGWNRPPGAPASTTTPTTQTSTRETQR